MAEFVKDDNYYSTCWVEGVGFCDDKDQVIEETNENMFHISESGISSDTKTIVCKLCGNKEFYVGTGLYFTAIKCKKCKTEICVHEG